MEEQYTNQPQVSVIDNQMPTQPIKKKNSGLKWIIIVILLLVIAGVAGFFLTQSQSEESATPEPTIEEFATPDTTASPKSVKGITTSVKFRSDRRAIVVTFNNLAVASSINYVLTYTTNGVEQGFQGSVSPTLASPQTREIIFGTCSSGTCRYDTRPTNAKLQITTILKTGKKVLKTYRIKI